MSRRASILQRLRTRFWVPDDDEAERIYINLRRSLGGDRELLAYVNGVTDRLHSKVSGVLTSCSLFLAISLQLAEYSKPSRVMELFFFMSWFLLLVSVAMLAIHIIAVKWWEPGAYSDLEGFVKVKYLNFVKRSAQLNSNIWATLLFLFLSLLFLFVDKAQPALSCLADLPRCQ